MEDAENTFPPSKKRAAGRELSRDNPGLDDEDDVFDQEPGTFKKASEEVLANRRIVKVRRSRTSSATSAPSSNPFAAIRLVPITDSTVTNIQETEKTIGEAVESRDNDDVAAKDEEIEAKEVVDREDKKETENIGIENTDKKNTEEEEKHEDSSDVRKPESADDVAAKDEETETKKEMANGASVSSFQQLSSSQNAFTGIIGTGFSSSTFSFGSITPTFPSFSFATNGNPSLFGNSPPPVSNKTEETKVPSIMHEVQVETGEENENTLFTSDSVLFEFLDGKWKERGKGELKINVSTIGNRKARLVMRARGNYRLLLNSRIFPDMKLTNMEKKGITFACFNSTGDGKDGFSTFALKFKDASFVEEFRAVVMQQKGDDDDDDNDNTGVSCLKTPENSPKASDE